MDESRPTQASPLQVARIIGAAMPIGVIALWLVAWFVSRGGAEPMWNESVDDGVALLGLTALMLAALVGALVMRARVVRMVEEAQRDARGEARATLPARVSQTLIIAWGLLEMPALASGVALLLLGLEQVILYVAPLYFLGIALTYPRAEWFGQDARGIGPR